MTDSTNNNDNRPASPVADAEAGMIEGEREHDLIVPEAQGLDGGDVQNYDNSKGGYNNEDDETSTILSESLFHSCMSTTTSFLSSSEANADMNTPISFLNHCTKHSSPSNGVDDADDANKREESIKQAALVNDRKNNGNPRTTSFEEENVKGKSSWAQNDENAGTNLHDEKDATVESSCAKSTAPSTENPIAVQTNSHASSSTNAATITTKGSNNSSSTATTFSSWNDISKTQTELSRQRPVVRSLTFNRDRTCLVLSTSVGVRIRTLESLTMSFGDLNNDENESDKNVGNISANNNSYNTSTGSDNDNDDNTYFSSLPQSYIHDIPLPPEGASHAQLLHDTSLLAVVRPSTPRCFYLYNAKNAKSPLAAMPLSAAIKRVELTRRVLVALTVDGRLHVFHMDAGGTNIGCSSKSTMTSTGSDDNTKLLGLRPTWIQTINILHPTDSLRNITRGLEAVYTGSYFDLSPNEDRPYLVCKSFNGTAGTIRVYDPTIFQEVDTITAAGSGNNSVSGRSTRSLSSAGAISAASSWDYHHQQQQSPSCGRKTKKRIHLLTTIDSHEHPVTRMLIGGGTKIANGKSGDNAGSGTLQQPYLATVSTKGTTIRIFALPTGHQLWEWHRGSRACQFHCLSWNKYGDRLVTYGSSGTIHVFDWNGRKDTSKGPIDENDTAANPSDHRRSSGDQGDDMLFQAADKRTARDRDARLSSESPVKKSDKPLIQRLGSKLRRRAVKNIQQNNPTKHRSFAKLKIQTMLSSASSVFPSDEVGKGGGKSNSSTLVVALLDRNNPDSEHGVSSDEDTLVVCSLDGELRQYLVNPDGSFRLTQMEDVLFRDANS